MNAVLILIISFIALLWAANHIVAGASGLAARFKLSPFTIGLTIIALGTTIPELIIFPLSYIKNRNHFIIGNAIGANIANIGLILGLSILIKPVIPNYNVLKKAYPIIIITMLFVYSLILDGFIGKIDGCLFIIACIALIILFIYLSNRNHPQDHFFNNFKSAVNSQRSLKLNSISVLLGLLVLPISNKYFILSITELTKKMGMNEYIIGFTVIALIATLPSLLTAITAVLKAEEDMAVGTILGSNIYSLLLVIAFPTIIVPAKVSTTVLWRDLPVMISLTILLLFLNYQYKKKLAVWHGGILLIVYCSYIISLVIKAHN